MLGMFFWDSVQYVVMSDYIFSTNFDESRSVDDD